MASCLKLPCRDTTILCRLIQAIKIQGWSLPDEQGAVELGESMLKRGEQILNPLTSFESVNSEINFETDLNNW